MRRRVFLTAAALAVLTCVYTWPIVLHPGSLVAHDRGDPLLVTWILWWSTHKVPLTAAWWNAPAFYPSTGVFAFSEHLLGLAPIAAPIIALTHAPLLAYNAAFLLSYVLCGMGAYLLGFVVTRRHDAAAIAALAFAFAPYRLSHTQHLQLLSSYWMPVAIASLHRYIEAEQPRWAILFAASWLLQALACGYYFFYLTLFAGLWLLWFGIRWLTLRGTAVLGVTWFAAALVLAPVLLGYRSIQSSYGFMRSPVEIVNYSADVAGLWSAAPDSLLWHRMHGVSVSSESEQFPGAAVLCLAAAALVVAAKQREQRATIAFYAGAAVLMWTLSLGPEPRLNGVPIGIPGPYAVLSWLPGFNAMRVPARLWMVTALCLSVCAGFALTGMQRPRGRSWIVACAAILVLLDGWPRRLATFAIAPMPVTNSHAPVRLGLPMRENETETMYGAIAQDRPVFNGYSGYTAPQHPALLDMLEAHDARILSRLAAAQPIEVLVDWATDIDGRWRGWLDTFAGASRVEVGAGWTSYEVRATGFYAPPPVTGRQVRVAAVTASVNQHDIGAVLDGDLVTRWHTARQEGGETITLDLGTPQRVRAVVMCLGAYPAQYPRALRIDVSRDGSTWDAAAAGGTVLETYDAAIQSPREVPVALPIDGGEVRFIRLRQTSADPHGWSVVELRVFE